MGGLASFTSAEHDFGAQIPEVERGLRRQSAQPSRRSPSRLLSWEAMGSHKERRDDAPTETASWWFVSTSEEQGWVPATYLEAQNGTRDDSDINTSKTGEGPVCQHPWQHLGSCEFHHHIVGISPQLYGRAQDSVPQPKAQQLCCVRQSLHWQPCG
ncbi:hypothetical protein J1605_022012 [Eschrichtius robustus]|uniref:SH3 domain-containing protein n=1 Tax=Eschrichtius robustus TaxID=9764 RepID=A0AB34HEZ7_ESCRO|nr:hypothetical protein J1605_022012 [Eschrichtius robustus]